MSSKITRRRFLHAFALGVFGPASVSLCAEQKKTSPNDRLQVGVIGVAGRGEGNWIDLAAAGAEIVALCDVDEARTGKVRTTFPKAPLFADFRKLIDAKGLDAVLIATPDHTHAPIALAALKAGLHVYCEKPLTHTVAEARLIAETAVKQKRVTQMGTQIHAGGNYRRVVELIRGGAIGKVSEVHVWVGTSWGGDGKRPASDEIPKTLDWDLWLGPAQVRPFSKAYVPFNWRRYWAFGGGSLNDMACHHMDLPFWALKLRHPTRIEATGSEPTAETCPNWTIVKYEFPGDVKVTWYDGGKRPKLFEEGKLPKWGDGSVFIGDKGMLLAGYSSYRLLPEDTFKDFAPPTPFIKDSIGHHKEWVEACKSGDMTTTCSFDYGGALTETVLLGTVAYRTGKVIEWDAAKLKARGVPEADRYIHKEYRKGWEVA